VEEAESKEIVKEGGGGGGEEREKEDGNRPAFRRVQDEEVARTIKREES